MTSTGFYEVLRKMLAAHDAGDEAAEALLLNHHQLGGWTVAAGVAEEIVARAAALADRVAQRGKPEATGTDSTPSAPGSAPGNPQEDAVPSVTGGDNGGSGDPGWDAFRAEAGEVLFGDGARVHFSCHCTPKGNAVLATMPPVCPSCQGQREVWPAGTHDAPRPLCPDCRNVIPSGSAESSSTDFDTGHVYHLACSLERRKPKEADRRRRLAERAADAKPYRRMGVPKGGHRQCELCHEPILPGEMRRKLEGSSRKRIHDKCYEEVTLEEEPAQEEEEQAARPLVLVADDDRVIADNLARALAEALGDDVRAVYSGRDADQAVMDGARWDLVVLDNSMPPGPTGLEVLRGMRACVDLAETPAILYTGSDPRTEAARLDAHYVVKPDRAEVLRLARELLGQEVEA